DRDHCIAAAGLPKKEVLEHRVTPEVEKLMEERKSAFYEAAQGIHALYDSDRVLCVASPILSAGDVSGAVLLVSSSAKQNADNTDVELAAVAADFLGKQME
ncbi:MAG: stage V sporulation protein T, partial [Clostridia bacterium]|nr:stage V sporulation protein T [Clostridia bacterium]